MSDKRDVIVVIGATGRQGGAVVRHLRRDGRRVRALTRSPSGDKARKLHELGAEVVRADLDDPESLETAFRDASAVYSVQSPVKAGIEGEIRQGKNVATAAAAAGVAHLVYGSAGTGATDTGVPHFDSKLEIEAYMKELELPVTVIRPSPFMELMTDRELVPPVTAWHVMPTILGSDHRIPWVAVDDIGKAARFAFSRPRDTIGKEIFLMGDFRSIGECRRLHREIFGRKPRRAPMPVALFRRVVSADLVTMWKWMKTVPPDSMTAESLRKTRPRVVEGPACMDIPTWMSAQARKGAMK